MADSGGDNSDELRALLEDAPLYKGTSFATAGPMQQRVVVWPDTIRRPCEGCGHPTSWPKVATGGAPVRFCGAELVAYDCAECHVVGVGFWVKFEWSAPFDVSRSPRTLSAHMVTSTATHYETVKATKIGQTDLPIPAVSRALTKLLGKDRTLYRRGLACMAEGFGLGSVAYFRRVIENKVGVLLDHMRAIADADGEKDRVAALDKAREQFSATERLKFAAEAVPQSLRRGGQNPLAVLYAAFSEELHASESDEAALETAQQLQGALEVVVRSLAQYEEDVEAMKLLQKR